MIAQINSRIIPASQRHKATCFVGGTVYPGVIGSYDVPKKGSRIIFFPAVGEIDRTRVNRAEEIEISPEFTIYARVAGFYESTKNVIPEIIVLTLPASLDLAEIAGNLCNDAFNRRYPDPNREDD